MTDDVPRVPARRIHPDHIDVSGDLSLAVMECGAGGLARELVRVAQAIGWWRPLEYAEVMAAFLAASANGTEEELAMSLACLERHELLFKGDDGKFRVTGEFIERCYLVAPAHQVTPF